MAKRKPPTPESIAAVVEHMDAIDKQQQSAHSRLRKDFEAHVIKSEAEQVVLRDRVELNARRIEKLLNELEHVHSAPINFDKIMFTPRVVGVFIAWLLAVIVAVVVSSLATTSGLRLDQTALRGDVQNVSTKLDAQKTAADARASLQDTQNTALSRRLDDVTRRLDMAQYDMQNLKDMVRKKP